MSQIYIEFHFTIAPPQPGTEILIAELGQKGFESFVEQPHGVKAYIQKAEWKDSSFNDIYVMSSPEFSISYTQKEIEQVNWNAEWEKNFEPIIVGDECVVRAPFHESFGRKYEIIIEPKMSFGTGHHETTFMMLSYLLEMDLNQQTVLDMGCGTSVLAILAEMKGATTIDAIDIDSWCVDNSEENKIRNHCTNIKVQQGNASLIPDTPTYHTIIANINRNILLADLSSYVAALRNDGKLLLSGFYKEDLPLIIETCTNLGLSFVDNKERNDWIAARFIKGGS